MREYSKNVQIFQPDFFQYRINLFKNITLKSFRQQTDKDFHLFLLHSYTKNFKRQLLY
ncbi:MAG: putative rhamnosyl transferase [Bacteroidales bacterium]|nr:putative rhamnosyl transferase [Bacteroidales bacterium]